MINPFSEINWKPGKPELRTFGKTVVIGLIAIAAILPPAGFLIFGHPFAKALPASLIMAGIGVAVFILCYSARPLAMPVYYVWFIVGASIGIVVSNALLIAFYYGVFTAVALLLRLTGRDVLKLKRGLRKDTYWVPHPRVKDDSQYFKQY